MTATAARRPSAPARLVSVLVLALVASVLGALPASAAAPMSSAEQQFLSQVNAHRANAGLPAVRPLADLTDHARAQSTRMAAENRLYHTVDLGGVVSGWMRLAENVGYGGSVSVIDNALINSPGHRANILNGHYTQVGIGVVVAPSGRMWVTQIFRTPDSSTVNAPAPDGYGAAPTQSTLPPVEPAAGVDTAVCPVERVSWFRFADVDPRATHRAAADCSAWWGLVTGTSTSTFQPGSGLTRAQLASIVSRAVARAGALPAPTRDYFSDDNGTVHEAATNALAEAGVVTGAGSTFFPGALATREQTAAIWVRAAELVLGSELPTGPTFRDAAGSGVAEEIGKAAAAGIVTGYADGTFGGATPLRREHGASLSTRALKVLTTAGELAVP